MKITGAAGSRWGSRSVKSRRFARLGVGAGSPTPILIIIAAVVAVHAPVLFGWLDPNPIHIFGSVNSRMTPGPLPGFPVIDPNIGFTSQALGHLSALDWFKGTLPWWNPYEGVGSPLAGGFQAAAFFPPTILTLLSNGQLFLHLFLESLAGITTFFLLRHLRVRGWIATLGGTLFALNGTFAWLGHAPANPVAFLPMLLLGIELAFEASEESRRGGWLLIPLAIALSIVAGFPETAYIDGLLATVWFLVRLIQASPGHRWVFALKSAIGGTLGLLLAAPLIIAVADYVPVANIGIHSGIVQDALSRPATPLLLMPYAFGPIDGFNQYDPTNAIASVWGGGFFTTSLLFLSLVALVGTRQRGLRIALAAWATFGIARSLGVGIAFELTKAVPFLDRTFFSGYALPSLEMAILLLALMGLDDIVGARVHTLWILVAGFVSLLLTGLAIHVVKDFLVYLRTAPGAHWAAKLSATWALLVVFVLVIGALAARRSWRLAAPLLCVVLFLDVAGMFVIPELSNPRSATVDMRLIDYLQRNLGTNRLYTLGPISPNYGSYFGIASINVNDVPVPKLWTSYIATHLDSNTPPLEFTGATRIQPNGPTAEQEFRQHIANYAWVGVKYVVTTEHPDTAALAPPGRLRPVYDDGQYVVLELSGTSPFFQSSSEACTLRWSSWNEATTHCSRATTVVRRELSMEGWTATVNGKPTPISTYKGLFQSVTVPAGSATVSFEFAPRHETWGIAAFGFALIALSVEAYSCWRRPRRRGGRSPQTDMASSP